MSLTKREFCDIIYATYPYMGFKQIFSFFMMDID